MRTYEEIKTIIEREGYIGTIDHTDGRLCILASAGYLKRNGEPRLGFVAEIRLVNNEISITEIRTGSCPTWKVKQPEDVLAYLLEKRPNIPLGEKNTWK